MEPIDVVSVAVRGLAFIAALQAVGLAWFALAVTRDGPDRRCVRAWSRICAACAIVLVVVHRGLDAGRLAGEWAGVLDRTLQVMVWRRPPGESTLACVLGLAIVGLGSPRVGAVGGGVVIASFALTGHTAAAWPLQMLVVGHVGIVAFWFGGVAALVRVRDLPHAATRFSRLAIRLVPGAAVLGFLLVWGLVPNLSVLRTHYGELLLLKIAGFVLVLGVAAYNRLRLRSAIARGEREAFGRLRRTALVEALVLAAVLATTATMTALYSCH